MVKSYSLEELAEHYNNTQSNVSRYVAERDYNELQQRNAELTAQVELLRRITNHFHPDPDGGGVILKDMDGFVIRGIINLLNEYPAQCLAEIKAQAVDGFGEYLIWDRMFAKSEVRLAVSDYANTILNQKGGE